MRTFRYCPRERINDALRLGWMVSASNEPWGVLVEWMCKCDAPWWTV